MSTFCWRFTGLPQTTKITTNGTLSTAVTSLGAKYYRKIKNVAPTYNGKRLTSRSHSDIDSDSLGTQGSDIVSNIGTKLVELTKEDAIGVFAVGMGAEYHSTIVIVSKNSIDKINVNTLDILGVGKDDDGKDHANTAVVGTNTDPSFIYVEDGGGARVYTQSEFEAKMQLWIYSARKFYRGDRTVTGAINGDKTKDASLDATVFELLEICNCEN